jgi:hypothetical protein
MIPARHAIRRLAAALAGAASLGMLAAPAWSTCSPPQSGGRVVKPFHADDGVVHVPASGLTWQRCSLGQHFNDGKCSGTAEKVDWAGAQQAAAAAGHGWRLPTQTELQGLLLSYCSAPATDTLAFPQTPTTWFWSASAGGAQGAWFVDFEQGGGGGATLRTSTAAVRLVRNGGER